jgi:hypothetical protein
MALPNRPRQLDQHTQEQADNGREGQERSTSPLDTGLTSDRSWGERFEQLHERVQRRIPPSISPEEIEAEITAAREEVRQAHRASRGR